MSSHPKSKPISKPTNHKNKPYRPQFNNNNPNNKLTLNKFHQIVEPEQNNQKKSDGFKLHKRKRDLERLIKHCEEKKITVDPKKVQQLQAINDQLGGRRKKYEKDKRKEFFLEQKYKDIKRIELRKVYKHLGETKANTNLSEEQKKTQIEEWEKKLRYIKHFPKTLKYISLFPSSKPLEEKTLEFQKKIMADIEAENAKRVARLNYYKSQNEAKNIRGARGGDNGEGQKEEQKNKKSSILPTTVREINTKQGKKKRQVVDDFFAVQEESNDENNNNNQQEMPDEDQSEEESQIDSQAEIDDQDDIQEEQEDQEDDE